MIFCARATRGRGLTSLDARSRRSISPHPWRENEQAWKEHVYRSMRAVEVTLPTPVLFWPPLSRGSEGMFRAIDR
jgi:hypothetical protein